MEALPRCGDIGVGEAVESLPGSECLEHDEVERCVVELVVDAEDLALVERVELVVTVSFRSAASDARACSGVAS